jgi:hypothetical protein
MCDLDHSGSGQFAIYWEGAFAPVSFPCEGIEMSGGVFISYRREDAAGFAGRIYDRLIQTLGRESVFIDVDNIPAGLDFVDVLSERVGRCDALIAVIGRNWLAAADRDNRRRLDDPNDFVRIEIGSALERSVPVIPVLVDGAAMPNADDLPDGLKKLARRQGIEISHNRFDSDAERLTDALTRIEGKKLSPAGARPPAPVPKPPGGPARWLLAAAGVVAIVGGAVFFYASRGAHEEQSRREEKAKPTSDVLKTLPLPPTTSTFKTPAPNAAANEAQTADSPPAKMAKAGAPDTPPGSQQWMNFEDFKAEYNRQAAWNYYPDKVLGRCSDGVGQRSVVHWSPRPAGQFVSLNHTVETAAGSNGAGEKDFKSDVAEMTAKGFKMKSDSAFQGCDGLTRHLTVWIKE